MHFIDYTLKMICFKRFSSAIASNLLTRVAHTRAYFEMLNFFLCVSNPRSMLARASSANEDYTAKHLSMYPVQFHITYSFSGERTSVSPCFFVKGDLAKNVCFSFFQIAMHFVSCWNEDL